MNLNVENTRRTVYLYDTLARSTKAVLPSDGKTIRMYTCGPTIYNRAHIGNFRTFIFEDILRRTLKSFGHAITQVMNLTDVDDKTIKGAQQAHLPLKDFTAIYEKAFFNDLKVLRIEPAEHYPKATDFIPQMIEMIQTLESKGAAYQALDGSVYFKVHAAKDYGKLSHLDLRDLQSGASGRVNSDEYEKQEMNDFVLWKAYDKERDGDVFWESPWGKGRPGWHIECSVMAKALLGETIDIHAGGVDLIFPHHENEIAQSETCNGACFSHHWTHAEHLLVDHKKMSKSLGNFYTLQDLLDKGFSPAAIRFQLLSSHYRTQLNFTLEGLQGSESAIRRIRDCYQRLKDADTPASFQEKTLDTFHAIIEETKGNFFNALANDLNISEALSHLFEFVRKVNSALDKRELTNSHIRGAVVLFEKIDSILDILREDTSASEIPLEVLQLVEQRKQARASKNWAESDQIRTRIQALGYHVEDTADGQKVTKGIPNVSKIDNKR